MQSHAATGQWRFSDGVLWGNMTGDTAPDFSIALTRVTVLNWGWLIA